ncbi:NAD-dependent epimerase/dehydratase family protein [Roseovarius faecimaris]|uniref:NAD-dependent epimerase/dehydratase family protein n=1 Tax=Roseovarius faecimaris TaxID=2494550 RepID=UPI001FE69E41|nr:NAD-dependent epimerase/dehydratase family protein [Roseovarius faecimaris]
MTKRPQIRRILVTGANGRLGRLLQGAAPAAVPAPVEFLFAARSGPSDLPAFDAVALPDTLPPADMVIGLWGVTSGSPAALARNATLATATQALARATGARVALHLSSAGVYGPGEDLSEDSPALAASDYGRAKLRMEAAVAGFAGDGIAHCCIRLANVVGADSLASGLSGSAPVTLTRFDDGKGPLRSYVAPGHLRGIFAALSALPAAALPPVLNVAAPPPVEMEALARAAGKDVAWKPVTPADRQRVTLNTARLAALLPDLSLPKTAEDMIADWQQARALA